MESENVFYATGKRKDSVAKVWLTPGNGKIVINKKDLNEYFELNVTRNLLSAPLILTEKSDAFDIRFAWGYPKHWSFLTLIFEAY